MNENNVNHLFFPLWAENNIYIINPKRGLIRFEMYQYQKTLADVLEENRFLICNKFRQSGITTMSVAYALWDAIWHPDRRIMFACKYEREITGLGHMVRIMLQHLPEQPILGKVEPSEINGHCIRFNNGSEIFFHKAAMMLGKKFDHLFIEEAAFIPNMEQHWQSLYPMLSSYGKCTVSSTPNGDQGWFYDTFCDAIGGKNQFKPIHLNWRDHPDYNTPAWESQIIQNLGLKGFIQEFACCFLQTKEQTWDNLVKESKLMSDYDILTKTMNYSPEEANKMITRTKLQKLDELKLQILAQNPQIMGIGIPVSDNNVSSQDVSL